MNLKTPLAKVKGLGSAKEGSHHWLMQRLTALALIFIVTIFVSMLVWSGKNGDIISMLQSPLFAVLMLLFITVSVYHGSLGIRVVIEDYVHKNCIKNFLIISCNFISIVLVTGAALSIVKVHIDGPFRFPKYWPMHNESKLQKPCHMKNESKLQQPCHMKEVQINSQPVVPMQNEGNDGKAEQPCYREEIKIYTPPVSPENCPPKK